MKDDILRKSRTLTPELFEVLDHSGATFGVVDSATAKETENDNDK